MLKWLSQFESQEHKGQTLAAIVSYTKIEITELGATDNTVKKYVRDLDRAGLIEYDHPFWKITKLGREWLERHSI